MDLVDYCNLGKSCVTGLQWLKIKSDWACDNFYDTWTIFFKLHFCEDLFTIFCAYAFIDGQPGSALADVVQISGQGSDLWFSLTWCNTVKGYYCRKSFILAS